MAEEIREITKIETEKAEGYEVKTQFHTYRLTISTEQNCCENAGFLASEDDLQDFVGCVLCHITLTDPALKTYELPEEDYDRILCLFFMTFHTLNKGSFQFVAYNCHNGYYGHEVRIQTTL